MTASRSSDDDPPRNSSNDVHLEVEEVEEEQNDSETAQLDGSPPKESTVVKRYYDRQNLMLANFKNDSEQIEAFNRAKTRKRALSMSQSLYDEKRVKTEDQDPKAIDPTTFETPKDHESVTSNDSLLNRHEANLKEAQETSRAAHRLANITLFVNLTLMIAKIFASWLSGSMSIFSSMVDSVVDLTSGLVLSVSARLIQKRDPYQYPRGMTRLEPLSLILISVIMGMASIQLIINSISKIRDAYLGSPHDLDVSWPTVAIMLTTVFTKVILYMVCKKFKSNPSIKVLCQDHRNDCISNSVALWCAWAATRWWYYLDPIGALVVSFYILYTWVKTGVSHILMLSGKTAKPEFINRIIKVCMDHDKRITHIDTVYVYHFGTKFLVEVHIVLDEKMPLKEAHDIAEALQTNIESLPDVERAFVHTDYDFDHHPHDEHKAV